MDKFIVELQKNCAATAVVVVGDEYKELKNYILINACNNKNLLFATNGVVEMCKEKLNKISSNNDICYLVIQGVDKLEKKYQRDFAEIVKDRRLSNYILPKNCIIVFTIENKLTLRYVDGELYKFLVIA